jgi:hypothetical protein
MRRPILTLPFIAACSALVGLACSGPPPEAPAPPVAPEDLEPEPPTTVGTASYVPGASGRVYRLEVEGQPTWLSDLGSSRDGISVTFSGSWPSGTTATLGETVSTRPGEVLHIQPFEAIGEGAVYRFDPAAPTFDRPTVTVTAGPLVLRLRNGVEVPVTLPPLELPYSLVEQAMVHAAEHGLAFTGEGPHEGPHSVYVDEPDRSDRVVGPAATIREIDRVAQLVTTFAPVAGRTCDYVGAPALPLEIETDAVTVRDRHTGAVIAEQTFTAEPTGCPTSVLGNRAILGVADQVDGWLTGLP